MEVAHEPRSFAAGDRPLKTAPIDERHPTLAALARGHNELHDCLDDARKDIVVIKDALGLGEGGKRVVGLSSRWDSYKRTVLGTGSAIVTLAVFYRIMLALWPSIQSAARAMLVLLSGGHI